MKEKLFKRGITRRLFSVVLALLLVFTITPITAVTVFAYDAGDLCTCGHTYAQHEHRNDFGTAYDTCNGCQGNCAAEGNQFTLDSGSGGGSTASYSSEQIFRKSEGWSAGGGSYLAAGDTLTSCTNKVSNYGLKNGEIYLDGTLTNNGDTLTGVISSIVGDKLYVCSNHTGSAGTLCDNCDPDAGSGGGTNYGGSSYINGVAITVTGNQWWLETNNDEWRCCGSYYISIYQNRSSKELYIWGGGGYITLSNTPSGSGSCSNCGATISWETPTHTHGSWDYTADGATLTAECKAPAGVCELPNHKVSLTLSASSENYSGSAVSITEITGLDTFKTTTGATIVPADVLYWTDAAHSVATTAENSGAAGTNAAPVNVGTYYATLTVGGETAVVSYSITKIDIESVTFTEPTEPVAGATPESSVAGLGSNYTGAIAWNTTGSAFGYGTAYTATVTLSAADHYKFKSDVTTPANWTKSNTSTDTSLVLTKTYTATAACTHGGLTTGICQTCGTDLTPAPTHTHNSDAFGHNADQHWTKCTEDEDNNGTPEDHEWRWAYGDNGTHYKYCGVCEYALEEENHSFVDGWCEVCKKWTEISTADKCPNGHNVDKHVYFGDKACGLEATEDFCLNYCDGHDMEDESNNCEYYGDNTFKIMHEVGVECPYCGTVKAAPTSDPETTPEGTPEVIPSQPAPSEPAPSEPTPVEPEEEEPAPAPAPDMGTVNIAGTTLNTWADIITNTPNLTAAMLAEVNTDGNNLLQVNIVGKADKTVPVEAVQALDESSIGGLHVFIGESDAVTFLNGNDYSKYVNTSFTHKDEVTETSRTIDFDTKVNLNAIVMFHTTVKPGKKVSVYKVVDGKEVLVGIVTSDDEGRVCLPIDQLTKYILKY